MTILSVLKTITYAIILIFVVVFVGLTLISPEMPKNWYPSVTMEELYE
jgi:hypothetical protein